MSHVIENTSSLHISLNGLRFLAYHGVMEQERLIGGEFEISLQLQLDAAQAHNALYRDELEATINYATVYEVVKQQMDQPSQLLEHVAARIAKALIHTFRLLREVEVRLTKCVPPITGFDGQGVSITYTQRREMVVWDFDGTIANTSQGIVRTMTRTFEQCGYPVPTPAEICATIGLPLSTSIAQLAHLAEGSKEVEQATATYKEIFDQIGRLGVELFKGVADEMRREHERGQFVCIATSRGHDSVDDMCHTLGIRPYIDHIVACEDVNTHKPDPTPVLTLYDRTNVLPQDTTVIGDTTFDIEMGRNAHAGCCIGVAWGNHDVEKLKRAGADKIAYEF